MKYLLSLIALFSFVEFTMAQDVDERIVRLSGCTGFMVDGDLVFTAKHCHNGLGDNISFDHQGDSVKASIVYKADTKDGPLVYKIQTPKRYYKSFIISRVIPKENDVVHTIGFPGGHYAVTYGSMMDRTLEFANNVAMRVNPGNSGAPLLNENSEIVGICLHVDENIGNNVSGFATHASIVKAFENARATPRMKTTNEVVIFSADWCGPCRLLEREVTDEDFARSGVKVIRVNNVNSKWDNVVLVKEFESTVGTGVSSYPTIWIRGTKQYQTGYATGQRTSVLGWVVNTLKTIGRLIFGDAPDGRIIEQAPEPEAAIPDSPAPIIRDTETVDWENVSIIILAKKNDIGYVKGKVLEKALSAIQGPLSRANAEFFEGKAELFLIDERTHEAQYLALENAAGIAVDKFYVLVLIKKQPIGLKGFIASKVEKAVSSKLPEGIPVELVFERIHSESYAKIASALYSPVTNLPPVQDDELSTLQSVLNIALLPLKEKIDNTASKVDGISVEPVDISEISETVKTLKKSQEESDKNRSWYEKIIAGILSMLGVGAATGGVRGFLAERAIKKAKELIHHGDGDSDTK